MGFIKRSMLAGVVAAAAVGVTPRVAGAHGVGVTPTVSAYGDHARATEPIGVTLLPVELGALSSHAGLQFNYSRFDLGSLIRGGGDTTVNILTLALEAQVALLDRLELGINLPMLVHGWVAGLGRNGSDTELGNLQLNVKAKLLGESRGPFALSIYANTTLPTTSADVDRDFALIHTGLALSGQLARVTAGIATGPFILAGGDDAIVLYNVDFFVGGRLHRIFAVQLAMQMSAPIEPSGGDVALAMTPALQLYPVDAFHVDVGARIGISDAGRLYNLGGRVALVVGATVDF